MVDVLSETEMKWITLNLVYLWEVQSWIKNQICLLALMLYGQVSTVVSLYIADFEKLGNSFCNIYRHVSIDSVLVEFC